MEKIRDYKQEDIEEIIRLFDLHNKLNDQEIIDKREDLKAGQKVLVYDDGNKILGLCALNFWENPEIGSCAEVIISTLDFKNIAPLLWEAGQKCIQEKAVGFLMTNYNQNNSHARRFFLDKGFTDWFQIHGMIYKGQKHHQTNLSYRNYQESDFENYHYYIGECFKEMRGANDIKPYNLFTNLTPEKLEKVRNTALEMKDSTYMFYDQDKFVGSAIIKHQEIDDIFVIPELQGQGYGRKIIEATLNIALTKNFKEITLGVVDWNKKAYNLYKSLGFETYQTFEFLKIIY